MKFKLEEEFNAKSCRMEFTLYAKDAWWRKWYKIYWTTEQVKAFEALDRRLLAYRKKRSYVL